MTDETYEGWSNRETWALMLHINNDQGLYEQAREVVLTHGVAAEYIRDEMVREWVESLLDPDSYHFEYGTDEWPDELRSMALEVGSLWRVSWSEVREALEEE